MLVWAGFASEFVLLKLLLSHICLITKTILSFSSAEYVFDFKAAWNPFASYLT